MATEAPSGCGICGIDHAAGETCDGAIGRCLRVEIATLRARPSARRRSAKRRYDARLTRQRYEARVALAAADDRAREYGHRCDAAEAATLAAQTALTTERAARERAEKRLGELACLTAYDEAIKRFEADASAAREEAGRLRAALEMCVPVLDRVGAYAVVHQDVSECPCDCCGALRMAVAALRACAPQAPAAGEEP